MERDGWIEREGWRGRDREGGMDREGGREREREREGNHQKVATMRTSLVPTCLHAIGSSEGSDGFADRAVAPAGACPRGDAPLLAGQRLLRVLPLHLGRPRGARRVAPRSRTSGPRPFCGSAFRSDSQPPALIFCSIRCAAQKRQTWCRVSYVTATYPQGVRALKRGRSPRCFALQGSECRRSCTLASLGYSLFCS